MFHTEADKQNQNGNGSATKQPLATKVSDLVAKEKYLLFEEAVRRFPPRKSFKTDFSNGNCRILHLNTLKLRCTLLSYIDQVFLCRLLRYCHGQGEGGGSLSESADAM